MKAYQFFVKEDYNKLPAPIKLKVDKLGAKLGKALASRDKLSSSLFSKQYLEVVMDLLLLALEQPHNFTREMIAAIGEVPAIEDIELSAECEEAVRDLMDAEVADDMQAFLEGIVNKIKAALGK